MSLSFIDKLELEEVRKALVPDIIAEISALFSEKRFVTQKEYADYYGYCTHTIAKRTNWLRSKGAVIGEGRQARYDKTYKPDGTRLHKI